MIRQAILDPKTGFLGLSMTGARSLLGDIVSADLGFLVFTFGSLLVAIQVAGGQYTPRIIATTLLRDNVIRTISGLFVFTMLFADRTLAGWVKTRYTNFKCSLQRYSDSLQSSRSSF